MARHDEAVVAHRGGDGGFTRFTRTSHGSTMAPEEHVTAEPAGDLELKGLHKPVPAFSILSMRQAETAGGVA